MLGIDPASVEVVHRDLPALRDLVLIDCPDPDTSEDDAASAGVGPETRQGESGDVAHPFGPHASHPPGSNLARLRAILPKCDVLLVTATQQKYRSGRVADELTAAACGAQIVFAQTHAAIEDDVRADWRRVLADRHQPDHIFLVDSLQALGDAQAGLQPRGEFAALLDRLTRQMAGTAAARIRRANFLDLAAETLDACQSRLDQAMPAVGQLRTAVAEHRGLLGEQFVRKMRAELLANRRQWERCLLGQTASRWGFSPFSLVLRAYQGLGALLTGAMLFRAKTPAQMALLGTVGGLRSWQAHRARQKAENALDQTAASGWEPGELRKASLIVEGFAGEAGLPRRDASHDDIRREADAAAAGFVARVSGEVDAVISRLAQRHAGWFVRWLYEALLAFMLGLLLYRLGKNFFYDSWFAPKPSPMFGMEFYVSAGFWLIVWCLLLLWSFCDRLRRGLRGEVDRLAENWRDTSSVAGLFAGLDDEAHRCERFRQDLIAMRRDVTNLRRQLATPCDA
jgi:hypothetical protein